MANSAPQKKILRWMLCLLPLLMSADASAQKFEFQKNDVVAIYGNGLADRMQHSPWVETVLQSQLKGKNEEQVEDVS